MKVIIIGSKGFIGQNLLNYLSGKGYDVWRADIITDHSNAKRYFLIDPFNADYNHVFQPLAYNLCINCSGAGSVPESITNPGRDYYMNTVTVFKILEAIKKFQPGCKFINLSSAAVYGDPRVLPVKEDLEPNPLSPYGFHKHQAEQICKEYHVLYGIPTCSLRIFSVYGPGLKKQLFWDLFQKAKTGVPFSLYGKGDESRDFIYISDLVKAVELVAVSSAFQAEVINIANGREIFIKDAVSIFYGLFGYDIPYTFSGDSRKGDPVNWVADISRLISFGYQPSIDINTGLEKYYEWIKVSTYG